MRFGALLALPIFLCSACGLDTVGSSTPPAEARVPEPSDSEGQSPSEAPPSSPAASPELTVTRTEITETVDLTAEGALDWIHWGSTTYNRRATGGAISDYTTAPQWSRGLANSTPVVFTWSDGTPRTAETGTSTYSYLNGADNLTATIAVRASRTPHLARFYLGGKDSHVRFTFRLADASAPPPEPIDIDQSGSFLVRFVTRFAASSDDTRLEVVSTLVSRRVWDGSVRIAAATLADR
jgi:hypothetical protein